MNSVAETLNSPKFQRYLLWFGAVVLVAGAAALAVAILSGGGTSGAQVTNNPQLSAKSLPLRNSSGAVVKTYEQLDPGIRQTVKTFISTAVAREHLGRSWAVVAPSMKSGYTKASWAKADALPVVPYPGVDPQHVEYSLDSATTKEILVDVGLTGKPGVKTKPVTFQLGLEPANNRWLVGYWMPRGTPQAPGQ
jgi:hypothetical protein